MAQAGSALLAIWLVFGFAPAIPYQPLYLLFVPLIWVAVRYGLPGAALGVFAIDIGLTFAAWITQAPHGSLPRLQLAMLALGITRFWCPLWFGFTSLQRAPAYGYQRLSPILQRTA